VRSSIPVVRCRHPRPAEERFRRVELLYNLPVPWAPDALELVYVTATLGISFALMVAFGLWWSR